MAGTERVGLRGETESWPLGGFGAVAGVVGFVGGEGKGEVESGGWRVMRF